MILVALGANLPGRFETPRAALVAAVESLRAHGVGVKAASHVWLTEPVPVSDQPWYHNAVICIETQLSPFALLELLQKIEHEFGRVRTVRNAPRVLDLDLVAYGDTVIDKPELILPHPRMHERAFVLLPMAELAPPSWRHPVFGNTLSGLVAALPHQAAKRDEAPFP